MADPARYYNAIAPSYDELHGEEQRAKHRAIRRHIAVGEEDTILDVGHGSGIIASVFPAQSILGIDIAERLLAQSPCRTMCVDFSELPLPFSDRSFDWVLCVTAFHHASDPEGLAHEFARIARRGVAVSLLARSPRLAEQRRALRLALSDVREERSGVDVLVWTT